MEAAVGVLKEGFLPGSFRFLIIGIAVGVGLLFVRGAGARWGRRWLVALAAGYWLLGIPVGTLLLSAGLMIGIPAWTPEASLDAAAIVVLDGGTIRYRRGNHRVELPNRFSIIRTLEVVRVSKALGHRLPVIVTAGTRDTTAEWGRPGAAIQRLLTEAGVPADRVILESKSLTTRESAIHVSEWLRQRHMRRVILVTSATHIRRAVMVFRAEGIDPIPAPVAAPDLPDEWTMRLLPSRQVHQLSEDALYDYMGLAYYWTRGWVRRR